MRRLLALLERRHSRHATRWNARHHGPVTVVEIPPCPWGPIRLIETSETTRSKHRPNPFLQEDETK